MNAISFIITVLNASLLSGALLGLFLDIPIRSELSNKERVQTVLMQTISGHDTEIIATKNRMEELEKETPLLPGKIADAKNTLRADTSELLKKMKEYDKASSTLVALQKQNTLKEKEIKNLALNTKNASTSIDRISTSTISSASTNGAQATTTVE